MSLVTVITPAHDRPKELFSRCIPSVQAQTYRPVEHLIVLDCPTPELQTQRWMAGERQGDYSRRFVEINDTGHNPVADKSGGAYGWRVGTHLARGDYIAFLGDDDEYLPNHLAAHIDALESTTADFSISVVQFYLRGEHKFDVGDGQLAKGHLDSDNIVARRHCFQRNNWNANGSIEPDFDLVWGWYQAGLKGTFVDEVTARHHDGWLARLNPV